MKDLINYYKLKKNYDTMLDFRKNVFKRTFCKHDFGKIEIPNKINMLCVTEHNSIVVCGKCGKIKRFEKIFY